MQEIVITIRTNPVYSTYRVVRGMFITYCFIGPGIYFESAALQWAGFIMLGMLVVVIFGSNMKDGSELSVEEARDLLDLIEAEEIRK